MPSPRILYINGIQRQQGPGMVGIVPFDVELMELPENEARDKGVVLDNLCAEISAEKERRFNALPDADKRHAPDFLRTNVESLNIHGDIELESIIRQLFPEESQPYPEFPLGFGNTESNIPVERIMGLYNAYKGITGPRSKTVFLSTNPKKEIGPESSIFVGNFGPVEAIRKIGLKITEK